MLIEVLFTLAGVIAGVVIVASLMQHQDRKAQFAAQKEEPLDTSKIQGIAQQLSVISQKVAANVSAHSEKVGQFSGQLNDEDTPEQLLSTINEIISANQAMQSQLADAQERIDQQSTMIEQASKQARTDALTGLANRRALDEFLTNSLDSAQADDKTALMLLDIDHFKKFNDSFGHTTGDAVLAAFARAITEKSNADCYPARFGGEEFAVIITGKSILELVAQAAEIRHFVSEQVISYDDMQLKITASGGLCLLEPGDDISAAYERADQGLYKSKEAGRNCGHWLDGSNWKPFPAPEPTAEEAEKAESAAQTKIAKQPIDDGTGDTLEAIMSGFSTDAAKELANENPGDDSDSADEAEIWDLATFMTHVEAKTQQLRRGGHTATALMVEAVGLAEADPAEAATAWEHTVTLIQVNLRGLDLVCTYRPHALAIFLPSTTYEQAFEQASVIHGSLPKAKEEWPEYVAPTRFAVGIATLDEAEQPQDFLNRVEKALDEAVASDADQAFVHTGESCEPRGF